EASLGTPKSLVLDRHLVMPLGRLATPLSRREARERSGRLLLAPEVDMRGVKTLTPKKRAALPHRARVILSHDSEFVLRRESPAPRLCQDFRVWLRRTVFHRQHASETFSPLPVIRKVSGV